LSAVYRAKYRTIRRRKLIACFAIKILGWDAHMILVIGALTSLTSK
jgi:hypothetical protein